MLEMPNHSTDVKSLIFTGVLSVHALSVLRFIKNVSSLYQQSKYVDQKSGF